MGGAIPTNATAQHYKYHHLVTFDGPSSHTTSAWFMSCTMFIPLMNVYRYLHIRAKIQKGVKKTLVRGETGLNTRTEPALQYEAGLAIPLLIRPTHRRPTDSTTQPPNRAATVSSRLGSLSPLAC